MRKLFVERLLVSSVLALSVAASKLAVRHNGFKGLGEVTRAQVGGLPLPQVATE